MTTSAPIALVTGAARRIGRAMALALAEDGFDLALHCNSAEAEAANLRMEIMALGRQASIFKADLASTAEARDLIPSVHRAMGPLSLLVNNASVFEPDGLAGMNAASWARLVDVNLTSPVFLMQGFAAQADLPDKAQIVNLLDQQMAAPSPRFFSYSVAKIGLEGATRLAALELAPKIRVNGIAPGHILPNWMQTEAQFRDGQRKMPLGEGLGPDHIVHALRYLIGADHVTGQVLVVDSGQHLIGPANSRLLPSGDGEAGSS